MILILFFCLAAGWKGTALFIKGKFDSMATDAAGNIYSVRGTELCKYDASGKLLCSYSGKQNGNIRSIDVKGGHRVLIYYGESQQILLLDNMLSPVGDIMDLKQSGIIDPQLCCLSGESGFWVFDAAGFQLVHLGFDKKERGRSPVLTFENGRGLPFLLKEREGTLLLSWEWGYARLLDQFGNPIRTLLPGDNWKAVELSGGLAYYLNSRGDTLYWNGFPKPESGTAKLPSDSVTSFGLTAESMVLLEPDRIGIYPKK